MSQRSNRWECPKPDNRQVGGDYESGTRRYFAAFCFRLARAKRSVDSKVCPFFPFRFNALTFQRARSAIFSLSRARDVANIISS